MADVVCEGDCLKAVELAKSAMRKANQDPDRYKLIAADNQLPEGPNVWSLTFKLAHLIPAEPDEIIGKGGELFVRVDTAAGSVKIGGYGE